MTTKRDDPEDFSIASLVKNRAAADTNKRSEAKPRVGGKSRNFVKPVKPLFEGKSLKEAMPRRNSDSSVSSHHVRTILEDDEVSLSSVQNLETIPSISESAGILSIISSNFRKPRSVTEQHIGELPDRQKLQEKLSKSPIVLTKIQQSSGVYERASLSPEGSGHDGGTNESRKGSLSRSSQDRSPNNNGINGPKRKDSLGLFRGASLRNLIKQAESNHRRMVALEDSDDEIDQHEKTDVANNSLSSPISNGKNTKGTVSKDNAEEGNHEEGSTRGSSRRKKRNSSFSESIKSPELRKAKERMRSGRRQWSSNPSGSSSSRNDSKPSNDTDITSPPLRSPSGRDKNTVAGVSSRSSKTKLDDNESSDLNDSFAWLPIVQSNNFFDSSTTLRNFDVDSQRGYSSDSSEYQHKNRTRWHMSKDGQQINERIRQQNDLLADTIAGTAEISDDSGRGIADSSKDVHSEMRRLQNEWHDASGNATQKTRSDRSSGNQDSYRRSLGVSKNVENELFRGRTLQELLPVESRKAEQGSDTVDLVDSMPSLATITTLMEEGSLSSDAFARHHSSKLEKDGSSVLHADQILPSKSRVSDPRRSILKKYKRSLEALNLEESNHDTHSIPLIQPYQWGSANLDRHTCRFEELYPQHPSASNALLSSHHQSRHVGLEAALERTSIQKSEHSEASSMVDSQFNVNPEDMKHDAILDELQKKAAHTESPSTYENNTSSSVKHSGYNHAKIEARKKANRMNKAIGRAFEGSDAVKDSKDALPTKSLGWQNLIQDIHRSPNKRLYPSQDSKIASPGSEMKAMLTERQEIISSSQAVETVPDFDWNSIEIHGSQRDESYDEEKGKKYASTSYARPSLDGNSKLVLVPSSNWQEVDGADIDEGNKREGMADHEETESRSSLSKKDKSNPRGGKTSKKSSKKCSSTDDSRTILASHGTGPFSNRPKALGPFSIRPSTISEVDGAADQRNAKVGGAARDEEEADEDNDDDRSTQSVDRHLVRESSHRRLLRKQVADRRESLQSILSATKRYLPQDEDNVLSLKRKLALSQALVQQLELEKSEMKRQVVMDMSKAQMSLLDQRDAREKELENQIKSLMEERNAAVEECHQLRFLFSGLCGACKIRFDHNEAYFMDRYVRHTVVSKQPRPQSTAFEWFAGNMSTEALDLELMNSKIHYHDSMPVVDVSLPESDAPSNFQAAPLSWLSERLFADHDSKSLDKMKIQTIDVGLNHEEKSMNNESIKGACIEGNRAPSYAPERDTKSKNSEDASAGSDVSESNSKKRGFFASLLGEKVVDEVHAFGLPLETSTARKPSSSKYSLFGSLQREKVEDDSLGQGLRQSLFSISDEEEVTTPHSKARLKSEPVLDDMALIDSLVPAVKIPAGRKATKSGLFGLHDEKVRDDGLDVPTVQAIQRSHRFIDQASQRTGRSFLRQEMVDVDNHDRQLLDLCNSRSQGSSKGCLKNPEFSSSLNAEADESDGRLLSPSRVLTEAGSPSGKNSKLDLSGKKQDQTLTGSNISSPFTWKRNRGKAKRQGAVPKYLGKYRTAPPSPHEYHATSVSPDNTAAKSFKGDCPSLGKPVSDLPYLDEGERPWRTKADQNLDTSSPNQIEEKHEKDDSIIDEIGQVASLMEKENSEWE